MIATSVPALRDDAAVLYQEGKELNRIFGKIVRTLDEKMKGQKKGRRNREGD